jgi:hypothetical protein
MIDEKVLYQNHWREKLCAGMNDEKILQQFFQITTDLIGGSKPLLVDNAVYVNNLLKCDATTSDTIRMLTKMFLKGHNALNI